MVLKGADSFFELPAAKVRVACCNALFLCNSHFFASNALTWACLLARQDFSLELEDAVSIHILESTSAKYDAVKALIEDGLAFETIIEGQGSGVGLTPCVARRHASSVFDA